MKSLIFKIFSVVTGIGAMFFFGSNSGRRKEQNKQLKQENDELQKDIEITREVNNLSFSDKSSFLLSKQKNKNNK
jgi:hypothetical protein